MKTPMKLIVFLFMLVIVAIYQIAQFESTQAGASTKDAQTKVKTDFMRNVQKNITAPNNFDPKNRSISAGGIQLQLKDRGPREWTDEELRERKRIQELIMANYSRPGLDEIIDVKTNEIIGDPQFLLDFAIVGFGKCGTSTIMHWLANHVEIQCFRQEVMELLRHRPDNLIRLLYMELPPGRYKRGYKAPMDIGQFHVLDYFRTYFPKTKLIVGVRHPILWFQSLYNFRVQTLASDEHMMTPNQLIGQCVAGSKQTCTEKGNFAYSLLKLGKFNYNKTALRPATELEEDIVGRSRQAWFNVSEVPYIPNQVFLYELEQLSDNNVTRRTAFRQDFKKFLNLKFELPEVGHQKPGRSWNQKVQEEKDKRKINICDERWKPVRRELLSLSRRSSQWLRNSFLQSKDVHVSSRSYVEELLLKWMDDPCGNNIDALIQYKVPGTRLGASHRIFRLIHYFRFW